MPREHLATLPLSLSLALSVYLALVSVGDGGAPMWCINAPPQTVERFNELSPTADPFSTIAYSLHICTQAHTYHICSLTIYIHGVGICILI